MSGHRHRPSELPPEFAETSATRGSFDGTWYTEEDADTTRLAIKVQRHLHGEVSAFQKIDVYQSRFFGRFLTLDDVVMFTERDEFVYHEMLVHVPLCSIPRPRQVLIVGGGDCGCLREVLRHPTVERVVQCEIDERVTRVCEDWFPWVGPSLADPRVELVFQDGAVYLEDQDQAFDLVVVDSTDPRGPAIPLFLAPFYRRVASTLGPGGVMTAQCESPHWSPALVGAIFRQQRAAFQHVAAYLGHIPTYQSGTWCWSYAANAQRFDDHFDSERALLLAGECRYYNAEIHRAAFQLPTFAQRAVNGVDIFADIERQR